MIVTASCPGGPSCPGAFPKLVAAPRPWGRVAWLSPESPACAACDPLLRGPGCMARRRSDACKRMDGTGGILRGAGRCSRRNRLQDVERAVYRARGVEVRAVFRPSSARLCAAGSPAARCPAAPCLRPGSPLSGSSLPGRTDGLQRMRWWWWGHDDGRRDACRGVHADARRYDSGQAGGDL